MKQSFMIKNLLLSLLSIVAFLVMTPEVKAAFSYSTYNIPYTVTGTPPTPSGTLTANDCTIASGGALCSSSVSWTTANLGAGPTSITRNTGSPASFTPSPLTSGSQAITLAYGTTTFSLIHDGSTLATDPATASCTSGTSWDGNSCEIGGGSPINGMCGASHWSCLQGTSTNHVIGGSSWTWDCLGSGGGSNDSCTELFGGGGGGDPECSDGIDNSDPEDTLSDKNDPGCLDIDGNWVPSDTNETDGAAGAECSDGIDNSDPEDILIDTDDPGCHVDGNAGNPASHDPNDVSELNKRKPIFIEF